MTVGASGEKVKEICSGVPHWAGVTLPNGKNGLGTRGGEEESLAGDPAAFGGAGEGDDGLL